MRRTFGEVYRSHVLALLQLMLEHGAVLLDCSPQPEEVISCQSLNSETLRSLATFDGKHEFIVDLLRAGAEFQLLASFCKAVATRHQTVTSICLCQAAVLAGCTVNAEELNNLQLAAASDVVLDELVNWLNEDRHHPPSLLRQCRVVIRRQLSAAVHYQTILPAIDKLPLPSTLKLYLQFDGTKTEVDFSINDELPTTETSEEVSTDTDSDSENHVYIHDSTDDENSYDSPVYIHDSTDDENSYDSHDNYYRYSHCGIASSHIHRDSDTDNDLNYW